MTTVVIAYFSLRGASLRWPIGDGVFGSTFYALTGFHGAHVSAGLLFTTVYVF